MNLFDWDKPFLKIDKPIRLIELFGGIGAQAKSLERLGVPFEHYRMIEVDRYAVASYNAIHGTDFHESDICKIRADDLGITETDRYCYIMTYSFPCQDLSVSGKGKGMKRGSGTRSGLLWEVERILSECNELPNILLMENVPQVVSQKHIADFAEWCSFLESLGYTNSWSILNAKDYGVPQNRERCYMVSFLGNYSYEFPNPFPLRKTMRDLLEESAPQKYYLSDESVERLCSHLVQVERERDRQHRESPRQTVNRQETRMGHCYGISRKEVGREIDCAYSLLARDWKGIGNQLGNGVVYEL